MKALIALVLIAGGAVLIGASSADIGTTVIGTLLYYFGAFSLGKNS